ncbi:MAG: hypothetical protein AB8G11_08040 [Saprospiraceae bacterium]
MPNSRNYYAKDIVCLAQNAISLSGIDENLKTQSKRKFYSTIANFVNTKAHRNRNRELPEDFRPIKDYRFFIKHYEQNLDILSTKGEDAIVTATTSYVNTLVRCTGIRVVPVIPEKSKKENRKATTNDLVDKWTIVFRRQNDLKGYNTPAEIIHRKQGQKELQLNIRQKQYKGQLFKQHDYFIATIKSGDVDLVIRINEELQQQRMFFTGTFMGKLPVYNQYPTGEIFMIRANT